MKKLLLFLFLLPSLLVAKDITVPVGADITPYVAQAQPGDHVILLAGNYSISGNAMLKPNGDTFSIVRSGDNMTYKLNDTTLFTETAALTLATLQADSQNGGAFIDELKLTTP